METQPGWAGCRQSFCHAALLLLCIVATVADGRQLAQESQISARIVHGTPAEENRFPYVASLKTFFTQRHLCGGTLVAPNIVITAAHCVDTNNPQAEIRPRVNIGAVKRHDPEAELRFTCKTILHPNWDGNIKKGFDIAAIILDKPSFKEPVELDVGGRKGEGLKLTALGWGRTHLGSFADDLQQMEGFVMIDNDQCNLNVVYNGIIEEHMLCADGGAVDTCEGDSGGPLVFQDKNKKRDILVGVTSFGPEICGSRRLPSVATRISSVLDWILKVIEENPSCSDQDQTPIPVDGAAGFDGAACNGKKGIDLNGGIVPMNDGRKNVVPSAGECCDLCQKTNGCRSWTWISSSTEYNPEGACWMRDAVPVETLCPACVSGFIKDAPPKAVDVQRAREEDSEDDGCKEVFVDVDLPGFDINLHNVPLTSHPGECCQKCRARGGCKAWTRTDDGRCFLKHSIPNVSICSQCSSGIMRDRVSNDEFSPIQRLIASANGTEAG